jgi:hypothetical protein
MGRKRCFSGRWLPLGTVSVVLLAMGCGGQGAEGAEGPPPAGPHAEGGEAAAEPQGAPADSDVHPLLAQLRPEGAADVLEALERSPGDAVAYLRAAQRYADTDAAGMAVVWGLSAGAIHAGSHPEAAALVVRVLRERTEVGHTEEGRAVAVRLAPGRQVPAVAQPDGSLRVPILHAFEQFVAAAMAYAGVDTWDAVGVRKGIEALLSGTFRDALPFALDIELVHWLGALAEAGHLEAFVQRFFGPVFADAFDEYEQTHPEALEEARAYVAANPFEPTSVVMPDDLIPMALPQE